jgi:hypothetical protein
MDCFVAALLAMTEERASRHCERREANPLPLRHCERSEAIHASRKNGLLRRCAPRNDEEAQRVPSLLCQRVARMRADGLREANPCLSVIASAAKQSMPQERMDCFVAALLAMTEEPLFRTRRFPPLRANGSRKRARSLTGSAKQIHASPSLRAQRSNPCLKKEWIASSLRSSQ